ncbi:hypothetical protein LSAT2_026385 [Lamellibrachia satsuma]|nr:hypothetical protein LSAT2_026385 [Lamellibrachia satsuma]
MTAVVFAMVTLVMTSPPPLSLQQQPKAQCVLLCREYRDRCAVEICMPMKEEGPLKYAWCLGRCVLYTRKCVDVCVRLANDSGEPWSSD